MPSVILWLIFSLLMVLIGLNAWTILTIWREYVTLRENIRGFLVPPEKGKPSALAQMTEAMSVQAARAIAAQMKMTFMGKESGDARAQKGIAADIGEDMLQMSNPMIASLLQSFPTLRRTLRRNPGLMDIALSAFGPKQGDHPNGSNNGGNDNYKVGG